MSVTINQGTQTPILTVTNSGTEIQVVKLDVGAGTATGDFGGTIKTVNTIGTLPNLPGGTIQAQGTVQVSSLPVQVGTSFCVYGTTGAAVWGTIIAAAGAGTKQYVSGVDIVAVSGTVEVAVTNIGIGGSTGAGVLARGICVAGGGISKNFYPVIASGTNGTISYWLGGAGTADITVQYWQGV
jgi:hypothetical protein